MQWAIVDRLGFRSNLVRRHFVKIFILHEEDGVPSLLARQPLREVEHLTVTQIKEDHTSPYHKSFTRHSRGMAIPNIDLGHCCFNFSVLLETDYLPFQHRTEAAVRNKVSVNSIVPAK